MTGISSIMFSSLSSFMCIHCSVPMVSLSSCLLRSPSSCILRRSFSLLIAVISRRISSSCSIRDASVPAAVRRDKIDIAARVIAAAFLISLTTVPLILLEQTAPLSIRSIISRIWACISEVEVRRNSLISSSSVTRSLASFF